MQYLFNDSKQIIKAAHALKHRKEKFIKWIGFIRLGGSSHYHWHDNAEPLADIRLPWRKKKKSMQVCFYVFSQIFITVCERKTNQKTWTEEEKNDSEMVAAIQAI